MKNEHRVSPVEWDRLTETEKHSRTLDRYGRAHERTAAMADFLAGEISRIEDWRKQAQFARAYDRMKDCSTGLVFREYLTSGKIKMQRANFCEKYFLCPFCAIRRAARYQRKYIERLEVIKKEFPDHEPWFVTWTVRNGFDLMERYTHLKTSFRAYQDQRRQGISRGRHYNELQKAEGAVYSTEIAFDKKGGTGWHPHIHMAALTEAGNGFEDFRAMTVDQKQSSCLSREWERVTGDSFVVDARPMHAEKDVAKNFSEIFKYALKFSDMSLLHNFQAAYALMGTRLLGSFGLFRGVVVPEHDNALDFEDLAFMERLYFFSDGGYSQIRADYYEAPDLSEVPITGRYGNERDEYADNEIRRAQMDIEAAKKRKRDAEHAREEHYLAEHKQNQEMESKEWLATIE